MAKRVEAESWYDLGPDATGNIVHVEYTCPYCEEHNTHFFFIRDTDSLEGGFETPQICEWCGKKVIVECH